MKRFSSVRLAHSNRSATSASPVGYTLIEVLVVVLIIAILSAIISPGYVAWMNNQRVGAARSQIADAMRKAQNEAKRTKINRELRFDNGPDPDNPTPRYAIVPALDNTTGQPVRIPDVQVTNWQKLVPDGNRRGLRLLTSASPLPGPSDRADGSSGGIVFNPYGAVVVAGDTTRFEGATNTTANVFTVQVTIGNTNQDSHRRCVIVRTLLGAFREESTTSCPRVP